MPDNPQSLVFYGLKGILKGLLVHFPTFMILGVIQMFAYIFLESILE